MKNLIIVFLTWRDYLNTEEKLLTSEYLSRLNKLIHDLRLVDILDKYDFTCYIKIHQEIKKIWTGHFNPSHRIITDQSIDFSDLMKHASILITDYSSIAWDFIFYDKPVIFYQFDKDTYEEKRGPLYVDVETQKLGLFIREHDDLVNSIESIIGNRSKSYRIPNKEKFFLYNDFENTKRVVSIIESII
jgi:CDP-glycerol glycerophosphotransferase (TagB/SpsB family)